VPYNGTDGAGCFGDVGPGILGFAAGLWDLVIDTSYLEPLVSYDFHFMVTKDTRTATADVTVFVQQPLEPIMAFRSVTYSHSLCRLNN